MDLLHFNFLQQNIPKENFYRFPIESYSPSITSSNPKVRFLENFLQFVPKESELTFQEKQYFSNILEILNYFEEFFSDSKKFPYDFQIGLAGGSLRDVFTKKIDQIKDLDIIVSIPKISDDYAEKKLFIQEVEKKISFQKMTFNNLENKSYCSKHMFSNIKIPKQFSYPVDLIFTNDSIEDFVQTFDFSICKIYYKHNIEQFETIQNLESWQKIYHRIIFTPTFLKDLKDKTITLNLRHFDENEIEYFLTHHYQRIKEKYFDYSLNMINDSSHIKEKIALNILEKTISKKNEFLLSPRIKI